MEFDLARRERFLALIAVGYSIERAAAAVDVSRQTVNRWASQGREAGASAEHASFAERLDEARREGKAAATVDQAAVREAELDALDEKDPFCQLPGDALGEAWRARVARREGKPPPEPVLPPTRDEAWAKHQAALAEQAEGTGNWPAEEDE